MDVSWLTFLGLSVAVIVTPGPDTALTVRNTLLGGRRAGVFTALGVAAGQITWSVATSLGLVALLLASEPIFQTLKLLGAAYLTFLGIQSIRFAIRGRSQTGLDHKPAGAESLPAAAALRQGVISNLANPKMAVFFASVLPQFAPSGQGMLSTLVLLGVIFSMLTFSWLTLYAVVIARAGRLIYGTAVGRALESLAGVVLIGLGVKLATETH